MYTLDKELWHNSNLFISSEIRKKWSIMKEPVIAQKSSYQVELEEGKTYYYNGPKNLDH